MTFPIALAAAAFALATSATPPVDLSAFAGSAQVRAAIADIALHLRPGEEMAYRPLLTAGGSTVALEVWVKPKQAAAHLTETEFVEVLDGKGTLVSGGRLVHAHHWYGETDGGDIVGGVSRPLRKGDVVLIPAGTPHWLGVAGPKLVLLTMHVPLASPPK